jgi:VIT1/CCC1 family predicted Fe2+/Mn2+ transporter
MNTTDPLIVREILKGEIPPALSALLKDEEFDKIGVRLKHLEAPTKRHLVTGKDFMAAFQIFLLVSLCTLPVAIPFALVNDAMLGMRISNGVALTLLFIGGFRLAHYASLQPWVTAVVYTLIGLVMVSLTMALGG